MENDAERPYGHAVVCIAEGDAGQQFRGSTLLRQPIKAAVDGSQDGAELTDSCASVRVGK